MVAVLVLVAHADVRALGDEPDELSGVCVDPVRAGGVPAGVGTELVSQRLCEGIAAAAPATLVGDDVVVACAVEGYCAVDVFEQLGHVLSQPLTADAAALFAPKEYEVARYAHLDHVGHDRVACAVVCSERGTCASSPKLAVHVHGVHATAAVNRVSVAGEHAAVGRLCAGVYVDVPCAVDHGDRQAVDQPGHVGRLCLAAVVPAQRAGSSQREPERVPWQVVQVEQREVIRRLAHRGDVGRDALDGLDFVGYSVLCHVVLHLNYFSFFGLFGFAG